MGFKAEGGEKPSFLKAIKDLQSLEDGEIKAIKIWSKKILKIKKKIILPQNLRNLKNIIELDLTRLNRELIYEIHEIARNAHNPNEK